MNFSISDSWNNSILLRYPYNEIKKFEKLYFYENKNLLTCQHFFNFNISLPQFDDMKREILEGKKIRFNYINDGSLYSKLNEWVIGNDFTIEKVDEWDAPQLILTEDIDKYLKNSSHEQIRRNYKKYNMFRKDYKFYNSKTEDILSLWNWVLEIDFNSWKKKANSDMKSLNREDLQYLPFLLEHSDDSNLIVVCDSNNKPLAYSLMFKGEKNYWYAVKWGASDYGRTLNAGLYCLFNHLEYLYSIDGVLKLDFWGRRNSTYSKLKNYDIRRFHLLISRGVE